MNSFAEKNYSEKELIDLLNQAPIFSNIPLKALKLLYSKCEFQEFDEDHTVIEQGQEPQKLYILLEGSIKVIRSVSNQQIELKRENAIATFGEMAIICSQLTSAYVISCEDCYFASIGAADFNMLLTRVPEVTYSVAKNLAQRLKDTSDRLAWSYM